MVVQKLRAAIEKCGLVLVALNDELFAAAEAVAAIVEIRRHPAYEKIRTAPGNMENSGEHSRGGGLAMCSGNDD